MFLFYNVASFSAIFIDQHSSSIFNCVSGFCLVKSNDSRNSNYLVKHHQPTIRRAWRVGLCNVLTYDIIRNPTDADGCRRMPTDADGCRRMPTDADGCRRIADGLPTDCRRIADGLPTDC